MPIIAENFLKKIRFNQGGLIVFFFLDFLFLFHQGKRNKINRQIGLFWDIYKRRHGFKVQIRASGLFICVDKNTKNWFPTNDKARPSDFEVLINQNDKEFAIEYKNEKLNLVYRND